MKITPILLVDEIEPSLKFWVDQLGFLKTVEGPEGDKLGFVILQKAGTEVMFQSRASVMKGAGAAADAILALGAGLYIEGDDFTDPLQRVNGPDARLPGRLRFYGSRGIFAA